MVMTFVILNRILIDIGSCEMKFFIKSVIVMFLLSVSICAQNRPMESFKRYNVLYIHGAADEASGWDNEDEFNVRKTRELADDVSYLDSWDWMWVSAEKRMGNDA
jgi:hypothetical protein